MEKTKGIGIISLSVSNIGKIKEIFLKLSPGVTEIWGENGAGKSTLLNAVKMAIEGKKAIPANIIRHGLDENGLSHRGEIILDTDTFTATVTLVKKDGAQKYKLQVTNKNGKDPSKAATFLDALAAEWNDPDKIARLSEPEMYKVLVDFAKIDLSSYDRTIEAVKEDQTLVRRDIKTLGMKTTVDKVEKVDGTEILKKMQDDIEFNAIQSDRTKDIESQKEKVISKRQEITEIKVRLELLETQLVDIVKVGVALPKPVQLLDIDESKEKLNSINEVNEKAQNYTDYITWKKSSDTLNKQFETNTAKITKAQDEKTAAVKNAVMPVEGFEITEEKEVLYNGFNWGTVSTSDKLIAAAMLIVNTTPENALRWMIIPQGEGILTPLMTKLHNYLVENNYTCLAQRASETKPKDKPGFFYISEGEIKKV